MSAAPRPRIERWVWIGLYGGLALASVGIALIRNAEAALGWSFVGVGVAGVVLGIVLVWVRSRMPDPPPIPTGDRS